jgi:cell division protein FtsI/penicillin-binding protein 2
LGVELGGEASGLMPDPSWKNYNFRQLKIKRPEMMSGIWGIRIMSIGQGYVLTTPLQMNAWTNVIANRGFLCRPTIKKATGDCKDLGITIETIDLITSGMQKACEAGGTGWPLFGFHVSVACKTGTAEFGDPKNRTHAWFTVFAFQKASP